MKYRIWDKKKQEYFKQGEWETFVWVDHDGKPFEIDITIHGCWISPIDVSEKYEAEFSHGCSDMVGQEIYDNDIVEEMGMLGKPIQKKALRGYNYIQHKVVGNKNQNKELWESL